MPRTAAARRTPPPHAARTRRRIVDAALAVFAEKGFRRGTIRTICRRAGANGAAANYHFGSQARLYRVVVPEGGGPQLPLGLEGAPVSGRAPRGGGPHPPGESPLRGPARAARPRPCARAV